MAFIARNASFLVVRCGPATTCPTAHLHCSTSVNKAANVGFIGLGNMGQGMVNNLLTKGSGIKVHAYDIDSAAVDRAVRLGAQPCSSLAEVVASSEAVITMLPNNDIVANTIEQCVKADTIKPGTFFLDSSTIDPAVSRIAHKMCVDHQCKFVDSPVSGGVPGADAGTLTFMVGADSNQDYETAKSILEPMGRMITHCGPIGAGQGAKLCNNMLLAISMIGTSEALNLGIRLGLDAKQLTSILCASTGRCWSAESYNPVPGVLDIDVPSNHGYAKGFNIQLIAKDLGLAQDAASRVKAITPLGSMAAQIYRTLGNDDRFKDLDFAAFFKHLRMDIGDDMK